jgi:hypothetical protein
MLRCPYCTGEVEPTMARVEVVDGIERVVVTFVCKRCGATMKEVVRSGRGGVGAVKVERVDVEVEGGVRRTVIEGRCTVCGAQVRVSRRLVLPSTYGFRRA